MTNLEFSKYHGLANDFLLLDDHDGTLLPKLTPARIRALCHRFTGVGADGILVRQPADGDGHRMTLFNADGSPAEVSGNGLRCFVLFLRDRGYPVAGEIHVETGGGPQRAWLLDKDTVETTMPPPRFGGRNGKAEAIQLETAGLTFAVVPVNVGNPHGVVFGPERDIPFAETFGPGLEKHPRFPEGANIEFVHVVDRSSCRFVVWERGAGITQACGSGSVATACAGAALGHFDFNVPISVHQPGGTLVITVATDFREVRQRGPAALVFEGRTPL